MDLPLVSDMVVWNASIAMLSYRVHRLISGRHTVGFKRVWMQGASEERIRCGT
jgi:hypothetical protein